MYTRAANGNDSINGGDGDDTILGEAHNDTLNGGAGNDTLTGGSQDDTFLFDLHGAADADSISDMTNNDSIALDDAVFAFASGDGTKNGVSLTDNTDIFDVAADFSGGNFGAGGGATFLYDATDGQIWYDADGLGGGNASLVATIDNFASYSFDATDFIGWA